jgi:hypothetical protein
MKRFALSALILTLAALTLTLPACNSHKGLKYLEAYVGQLPSASGMWKSEPLHTQLKELTGDQYDQFVKYMDAASPLVKDTLLYTLAPIAHDSTKGYAYILIDTKTNNIQAAMETNMAIQKFQSPREAFIVPQAIQQKLDSALR